MVHRTFLIATTISVGTCSSGQNWTVFDMDNAGFPSNTVKAIVQDEQDIIWAATDWGLCRYDGSLWTVYQQGNSGLPDNSLNCLALDGEGRLWVGTTSAGIAILDPSDETWSYIDMSNSILVDNEIAGITHDHRGWSWISTPTGLFCWTGVEWRWYNDTESSYNGNVLFGPNMSATAVRADELVTVATRNAGLTYITEDDFLFYTSFEDQFPDNSANAVALDALGDRWLACPAGGLIRHAGPYEGGPWFQYNGFTTGLPDNTLTSILIDALDRKIAGTETAGILVFAEPSDWFTLDQANSGLPDDWVLCVMLDNEGSLWAGTKYGGLARNDGPVGIEVGFSFMGRDPLVYPNPCGPNFNLDLSAWTGKVSWTLMDTSGRAVRAGVAMGGGTRSLSVSGCAPGSYLLHLRAGLDPVVIRLVIQ